jgi:phosphoglycolate phosphatase
VKQYRAVFFDLDGTLIDSFDGIVRLFLEALAAHERPDVTGQQVREIIGAPLADCFANFLPGHQVDAAVKHYRAQYEVLMHDISPGFPGAPELLAALSAAGRSTGVISNKRAQAVRAILAHKGWPLHIIVGEGDGPASKPAPDMLFHAAEKAGVGRGEVLYVGDSSLDARAAQAAQMDFVGLTTGELTVEQFRAFPHVGVYASLDELRRALGV